MLVYLKLLAFLNKESTTYAFAYMTISTEMALMAKSTKEELISNTRIYLNTSLLCTEIVLFIVCTLFDKYLICSQ